MKFSFQSESALVDVSSPAPLDLVVPVTTPELTRAGIRAAERLASGLNAEIRLLKIQVVPFPLQITASPVPLVFLREQLENYVSCLPLKREIKLARDFELIKHGKGDALGLRAITECGVVKINSRFHFNSLSSWLERSLALVRDTQKSPPVDVSSLGGLVRWWRTKRRTLATRWQ